MGKAGMVPVTPSGSSSPERTMKTTLAELTNGQPFLFLNKNNGHGEYVKEGNTHYRKAGSDQNVSMPITSLPAKGGCRVSTFNGS